MTDQHQTIPEQNRLRARLAAMKGTVHAFPGTDPTVSQEDVAREMNSALDQLERGEAEVFTMSRDPITGEITTSGKNPFGED